MIGLFTCKIIENIDNAVFSNDDIVFGDIDSVIVTFFNKDLNSLNLNNTNLDDDNFDDYDPEIINHIRLMTWYDKCKTQEAFKKEIGK